MNELGRSVAFAAAAVLSLSLVGASGALAQSPKAVYGSAHPGPQQPAAPAAPATLTQPTEVLCSSDDNSGSQIKLKELRAGVANASRVWVKTRTGNTQDVVTTFVVDRTLSFRNDFGTYTVAVLPDHLRVSFQPFDPSNSRYAMSNARYGCGGQQTAAAQAG